MLFVDDEEELKQVIFQNTIQKSSSFVKYFLCNRTFFGRKSNDFNRIKKS